MYFFFHVFLKVPNFEFSEGEATYDFDRVIQGFERLLQQKFLFPASSIR
jgi:hypothetical protein